MNVTSEVCWKKSLKEAIRDPFELLSYLGLEDYSDRISKKSLDTMPLMLPLSFASRIKKKDIRDPILLQVFPSINEENIFDMSFVQDPLMEQSHMPAKGVIHKYKGRVLLICSGGCAVHCRYCFRREFDYKGFVGSKSVWEQSFHYVENDQSINEVILSGGDPLLLTDNHIEFFIRNITKIKHIKRLRIHSRVPIVLPERITDSLVNLLSRHRLQTILVTHVNHENELDKFVKSALNKFKGRVTLLNQSTLLKGINDSYEVLEKLSERLFDCGVLPYYLHTLDKVRGTKHFYIDDDQALDIHTKLQASLPGFLVPKLVKEVPFQKSKTQLSDYLLSKKSCYS